MDLNRVRHRYDDGSEWTDKTTIATIAAGTALAVVGSACVIAWDNYKERRMMKKYRLGPYANK